MRTPTETQRAADIPTGIYQDLEESLMKNIIRHCNDYQQPIATDEWLLKKLAEIGSLTKENIHIIAKSTGLSQASIERMLLEMAEDVINDMEPVMRALVKKGFLGAASLPPEQSANVKSASQTLIKQAKQMANLCNTTMLYMSKEAYSTFVNDIAATAKEIELKQSFIDVLNANTSATILGAESRQQALRKCIREFNDKGIPAFVDKKGREWTPEAYINMSMRSTSNTVAAEVQMARADDYGIELLEVDSHSGARPKCSKDQGKIFDKSNKSSDYPHWKSSSYGEPDGILGINCGHHIYPFIDGVHIRSYFPQKDSDENDQLYRDTQKQRAFERDVRRKKRECMLYKEAGDEESFKLSAVRLKQKELKLSQYVKSNSKLHRRKDREQVVGFDKRISASVISEDKAYTKAKNTDTIHLKEIKIHKSVGSKYKNYRVIDKSTGLEYEFVPGTRIQDSEVFAGKGTKHSLHSGVAEGLTEQYGGDPSKWQHAKGIGVLEDTDTGEQMTAEVHWFQEESVGKVNFKVKKEI